jgi:hypothetical protein
MIRTRVGARHTYNTGGMSAGRVVLAVQARALAGERWMLVTRAAGDDVFAAPPFEDLALPLASVWR